MESDIISFYKNKKVKKAKRKLSDIWNFSDEELEQKHDYIQWLFPLIAKSSYNPDAPLLDKDSIRIMKTDVEILTNIKKSLVVILSFFGWKITESGNNVEEIIVSGVPKEKEWLNHSHNFLRVTRILTFLSIIEQKKLLFLFFLAMCKTVRKNRNNKGLVKSFLSYWIDVRFLTEEQKKYIRDNFEKMKN